MEYNLFEKILRYYGLAFVVFWLGAMLLAAPETHWITTSFGVLAVHAWVYFVHRALHYIPEWTMINTHMKYHHQEQKTIPRHLELFYETITDTTMNMLLLVVQRLAGITIIPTSIILLFTLSYMSIHIINYSIFGSVFHRRHHETMNKNFAPDAMDHIFGTNYNDEFEDLNPTCLNVFGSMALLYPLKEYLVKM